MVGMSKSVLGDIERGCGNASLRTLVKLAAGLNVTVADFFGNGAFEGKNRPPCFGISPNHLGQGKTLGVARKQPYQ